MTNPCCVYDFTAPCDSNDILKVKNKLKEHCKKWCFQKELSSSGYNHYQGRFSLKLKKRLHQLVDMLDCNWHFSITSNENQNNNFYVMKEDTRIEGPWSDEDKEIYIPRQIREISELYEWQKVIVNSAKVWDKRTINIVVDFQGNNGKSILKTYIGVHEIGRCIPFSNDYRDLMRIVMDTPKKPLYIIDIPRALKKEFMNNFFGAIESIKDGYAYDDRYKFKEEYFDCPNIWVFTNVYPDTSFLSKDRWCFWELSDHTLVKKATNVCNTSF